MSKSHVPTISELPFATPEMIVSPPGHVNLSQIQHLISNDGPKVNIGAGTKLHGARSPQYKSSDDGSSSNWMLMLFGFFVFAIIVGGVVYFVYSSNKASDSDKPKGQSAQQQFVKEQNQNNNNIGKVIAIKSESDWNQLASKNEPRVVAYTMNTCHWCNKLMEPLNQAAAKSKLPIYNVEYQAGAEDWTKQIMMGMSINGFPNVVKYNGPINKNQPNGGGAVFNGERNADGLAAFASS